MQKRMLILVAMLMLLVATAARAETTGLTYNDFRDAYAENINFINDNAGRMLLPLVPAKRDAGWGDGREIYEVYGDVLSLSLRTEYATKIVESCLITLTAPPNMEYGSSIHKDFTTSGYQSYAMLMAMAPSATPYERYQLVVEVEAGLAANGTFQKQLGVYTLEAASQNGCVTLLFTNTTAAPTPSPVPTATPVPEPAETPDSGQAE